MWRLVAQIDSNLIFGTVALLTAVATALGTYLGVHRRTTGSVRTSDAVTLWTAEEQFRKDLVAEMVRRGERIKELEGEIDRLENRAGPGGSQ